MTASRRGLLTALGAASVAAPIPTLAATSADADLIRLGRDLDAAWAVSVAAYKAAEIEAPDYDGPLSEAAEATMEAGAEIVDQIKGCTATTLSGIIVKTRAIHWCQGLTEPGAGDPILEMDEFRFPVPTTDRRILLGLLDDLTRLAGRGFA